MILHLDFETRSAVELGGEKSVGLYNYATHPSTKALMLAWAYDEEPVEVWLIGKEEMPARLKEGLGNPNQKIAAYNSSFERYIAESQLGYIIPIERFIDPQASARYLSLPGNLDDASTILGLGDPAARYLGKDKEGERLIKVFCIPTKKKKKRGEPVEYYFRDETTDPEDWVKFIEYCRQDVVAEREVMRRLGFLKVFPLPQTEQTIWQFDQRVNDRGLPVDVDFVQKALALATAEKKEMLVEMNHLTGLENSNSPKQMLNWVRSHGYKANSLRKEAVAAAIKYDDLPSICKQVLELRKASSSTSYKKLAAILRQVNKDGRLRNQFLYMGSSRCGRWSGNGFQFHNMARPSAQFEDLETVDRARKMIYDMDYYGIKKEFGSVLLTVKNCIRTAFVAKQGHRFNVCDLNAIETRVAAWVAGCQALLDVFLSGRDPYLDFAAKMTGIPYEKLAADIKSKDPTVKAAAKGHRQMAKPGVLGCVYRLGGGQMGFNSKTADPETGYLGDPIKQGLWGYAENMGVQMTQEQAHFVVRMFRESYPEIPKMWTILEKAIADVLKAPKTTREVGPNGCIKIDKLTTKSGRVILRIQLPSGRYLHYMDACLMETKMPWQDSDGNDVYRESFCYKGQDQTTKQWSLIVSHGGKTFENIVQAFARDILAHFLVQFENILDLPICGHVHDEGVSETKNDCFAPGVKVMERTMGLAVSWAPGLPLKADGFESLYYHK